MLFLFHDLIVLSSKQKVIKLVKASLPLKLWPVENPKLTKELIRHEELKKREVRCYKIGILYAKEGQKKEEEILANREYTLLYGIEHIADKQTENPSDAFERFLRLLGDKIELAGWQGYRGDLDVVSNKNGEHSIFTKLGDIEVFEATPIFCIDSNQVNLLFR